MVFMFEANTIEAVILQVHVTQMTESPYLKIKEKKQEEDRMLLIPPFKREITLETVA